jgi:cyclopropane fatty-acyl-phospholipid synthase-like methyltransferase
VGSEPDDALASQWDEAYRGERLPPWDIGRPQPAFVRLAEARTIAGRIIDIGCGTGENALMLAAEGCDVVGVDIARSAVERARAKAATRRLEAELLVWDVLELAGLVERTGRFDGAIDSGVFHTFSDEDRPRYARSVAAAVRPDGRLWLMCFSEREPDWGGPRRVTRDELRDSFSAERGWSVESIAPARFVTTHPEGFSRAWLASIRRTP